MPERPLPLAVVARLPGGSRAAGAGRLVDERGGAAFVADLTGKVSARFVDESRAWPAVGTHVEVEGTWDGERLLVDEITVGIAPTAPFPRPDGDYLWLAADGGRRADNLRRRAATLGALRAFFDERGFVEVETPHLVRTPGTELHLEAFRVEHGGEHRFLITSPELHMKRLLAGGLTRIYQVARVFRRDEAGHLHEPEFTMLEWYRGFAGSEDIMRDTEALVASVARDVVGEPAVRAGGALVDVSAPWARVRVAEALMEHAGLGLFDVLPDEERFFRAWVDAVEPKLGKDHATFVTHWPRSMASLARILPDEPDFADRFEAYVGGVELCNGFGELVDPREQRRRTTQEAVTRASREMTAYPVDERFLGALEEGLPRSAGNALGVDRLVMMLSGEDRVADVTAFPWERA